MPNVILDTVRIDEMSFTDSDVFILVTFFIYLLSFSFQLYFSQILFVAAFYSFCDTYKLVFCVSAGVLY